MGFPKLQVNCLIHKKSYGFCLITLKMVNWQEEKMHTFMKTKYIPHGHL
jgi:hypothetical protein